MCGRACLKKSRRRDQHHKCLRQILNILLEVLAGLDAVANARAFLQDVHKEHPVLAQEPAGRSLGRGALWTARQYCSADDAGHTEKQGVELLKGQGLALICGGKVRISM